MDNPTNPASPRPDASVSPNDFEKISAALLVGMAAGLTNFEYAKGWETADKSQFADLVDIAKRMLWQGEPGLEQPTTEIDHACVTGLVDDLMLGLVTGEDAYKEIKT